MQHQHYKTMFCTFQGDALCKDCFYSAFEEEVHHTITTAHLFSPGDRVAVGASGGKGLYQRLIVTNILSQIVIKTKIICLSVETRISIFYCLNTGKYIQNS